MAKLVVLITGQIEQGHTVAEAWQTAGAPGVTIIEGHGLRRLQETWKNAEILPGTFSLQHILRESDRESLLILSLVNDDTLPDKLIAATQAVLGDMTAINAGILFVLDVAQAVGITTHAPHS